MAQLQRWTLRAGLFLLPLAYLPNAYDRWVLPKLVLGRLLVLVLGVLFGIQALRRRELVIRRSPLELPLLAMLASALVSTVFAVNVNVAIFGTYSRYDGLLTLVTYTALFWLALQTIDGPDDAWALLRTLVASAYVVAAIAIGQSVFESLSPTPLALLGTDALQGTIVRAYGSLGQWEVLGEFLVLAWPIALWEAATRTRVARVLAINAAFVIGMAMVLTFSRSTWAAAVVAGGVVLIGLRPWVRRRSMLIATGAAAVIAVAVVGLTIAGGSTFEHVVGQRATTIFHPGQWDVRPGIWRDSLGLIASRPLVGYGPDTFGLVFPSFNTVAYTQPVDKAHAELLQIAATQGLIGVAAYGWILFAFGIGFWRARFQPRSFAVLAGVAAYEAMLQVNFTAIGSALPFWVFAAAAMHCWGAVRPGASLRIPTPAAAAVALGGVAGTAAAIAGVLFPLVADISLLDAVDADVSGNATAARAAATRAEQLAPEESVYAVELGNIAFERNMWKEARDMYTRASRLGTYNPLVYRNLAISDRELGLLSEGRAAARAAYELNRFDPVNQALLAQFENA